VVQAGVASDGVPAVLWCRDGIDVEHRRPHVRQIAVTCWAKEVRVYRSARWTRVVTVEVVRRDPPAGAGVALVHPK
jgi:hypothetical protein